MATRGGSFRAAAALALFLAGCATTSVPGPAENIYRHTPAEERPLQNTAVVAKPFEHAWNDMVRNLTVSFYRINQVAKDSRVINLDLEATDAEKYVDCGTSYRAVRFNGLREWTYPVASNAYYEFARQDRFNYWYEVTPETRLRGVINIYISPRDAEHTEVSVNVRYEVEKIVRAVVYTQRQDGQYRSDSSDPRELERVHWTFTTTQPSAPEGDKPVCRSSGRIESEILDFARR